MSRPPSKRFVRISPEQIVQIIVTLGKWQRSHSRGKDDLVGARAELYICPEEFPELRRYRVAIVSDPQMARCQAGVGDLPANSDRRHQPELDLMAVRLPVDVDVINSNRSRTIVLVEMQADAIVHDAAISLGIADRIRKVLKHVPAEKVTLSTDCGMKPLARMVAKMKLGALAEGAAIVRKEIGTK